MTLECCATCRHFRAIVTKARIIYTCHKDEVPVKEEDRYTQVCTGWEVRP